MKLQRPIFSQQTLLVCFSLIWLVIWIQFCFHFVFFKWNYYKFALNVPVEFLHAYHAVYDDGTVDYYQILKICDRVLPAGEELQIIVPSQPTHRFNFLWAKARYVLYPRNYGNNDESKDYILVYERKDFIIPAGYEKIISFGADKYLLRKTQHL